ncbi:MAG: hypothetical protein ACRDTG_29295 [Pseudonocardiaceae bacterium]
MDWARITVDQFTTEAEPKAQYIASARFILAHAYLTKGDLEAVGEHLVPILHTTTAEYRTVPTIGRARSLHTLLAQRAEFITHPTATGARHPYLTIRGISAGRSLGRTEVFVPA